MAALGLSATELVAQLPTKTVLKFAGGKLAAVGVGEIGKLSQKLEGDIQKLLDQAQRLNNEIDALQKEVVDLRKMIIAEQHFAVVKATRNKIYSIYKYLADAA